MQAAGGLDGSRVDVVNAPGNAPSVHQEELAAVLAEDSVMNSGRRRLHDHAIRILL